MTFSMASNYKLANQNRDLMIIFMNYLQIFEDRIYSCGGWEEMKIWSCLSAITNLSYDKFYFSHFL
jgi:hypothetical protein